MFPALGQCGRRRDGDSLWRSDETPAPGLSCSPRGRGMSSRPLRASCAARAAGRQAQVRHAKCVYVMPHSEDTSEGQWLRRLPMPSVRTGRNIPQELVLLYLLALHWMDLDGEWLLYVAEHT